MADMGWSWAYDDPIEIPDGRVLRTLREAGHYVTQLRSGSAAPGCS